jgi:hypothetical protein
MGRGWKHDPGPPCVGFHVKGKGRYCTEALYCGRECSYTPPCAENGIWQCEKCEHQVKCQCWHEELKAEGWRAAFDAWKIRFEMIVARSRAKVKVRDNHRRTGKKCPECGARIDDRAEHCPTCAKRVLAGVGS